MPSVEVLIDRSDEIARAIKKLADIHVMVGIPKTRNERRDDPHQEITNAALGYIHEHGSPVANIPARPFLQPGVKMATAQFIPYLVKAAGAAMEGQETQLMAALNAAGIIAVNSVRKKITEGPFTPLSPRTIAARKAKLKGTTALSRKQKDQGFTDIRPLIDTGQLRQSITYVIRSRGGKDVGGKPNGVGG